MIFCYKYSFVSLLNPNAWGSILTNWFGLTGDFIKYIIFLPLIVWYDVKFLINTFPWSVLILKLLIIK